MTTLIDLPGRQGAQAEAFVESAIEFGTRALHQLAETAVARFIAAGRGGVLITSHLFDRDEIERLIEVLAAVVGTADLMGQSAIWQQFTLTAAANGQIPRVNEAAVFSLNRFFVSLIRETAIDVEPMPPAVALEYFRSLTPAMGIDPQRWGADLRRRVFTMAAATDTALLARVQGIVADRLQSGQGISTAAADIQDVLTQAGVTPRNPQYAEMVWRTNSMDAYNQARQQAINDPDVAGMFPVWEYVNPVDSRSRPDHAARNGQFYPASASFTSVRGTDAANVVNCRCSFAAVSKFKWRKLKAAGAKIADGFQDVPSLDEVPEQAQPAVTVAPPTVRPAQQQIERRVEPFREPPPIEVISPSPADTSTIDALNAIRDNYKSLTYVEIESQINAILGSVSKVEAIQAAQQFGISATLSSRAEAIRRVVFRIHDAKESWDRAERIVAAPLKVVKPATGPVAFEGVDFSQQAETTRVELTLTPATVVVELMFPPDAPKVVVKQGGTFLGWTWEELRQMGDGLKYLKRKI